MIFGGDLRKTLLGLHSDIPLMQRPHPPLLGAPRVVGGREEPRADHARMQPLPGLEVRREQSVAPYLCVPVLVSATPITSNLNPKHATEKQNYTAKPSASNQRAPRLRVWFCGLRFKGTGCGVRGWVIGGGSMRNR